MVASFDVANASNIWRDDAFCLTLFGTKGGLRIEAGMSSAFAGAARVTYFSEQEKRGDIQDVHVRDQPGRQMFTVDLPPTGANMFQDFVDACQKKRAPITPGSEGIKIVQITNMAYLSAKLGREVTLKDL